MNLKASRELIIIGNCDLFCKYFYQNIFGVSEGQLLILAAWSDSDKMWPKVFSLDLGVGNDPVTEPEGAIVSTKDKK